MVLRIFETEEAKYYLGLGNHLESSAPLFEDVDFSELDFIVLENGGMSTTDFFDDLTNIQYSELSGQISEHPSLPIYAVDFTPELFQSLWLAVIGEGLPVAVGAGWAVKASWRLYKEKASRRSFLKNLSQLLVGTALAIHPVSTLLFNGDTELFPPLRTLYSVESMLLPTPIVGFRDALCAKKISEYLVPRHWQPGKKVTAAIVYGAGHSGIELQLQNPNFRDATLELYADVLGYASPEELNRVLEIRSEQNGFLVEELDCGIF